MSTKIKNKADFNIVFNEYYIPLCHFLKSYTSEKAYIEDVVQDVFVKLWKKREEIEIKNIKSYLFTAVKNVFLDYKKKDKNHLKYINEQKIEFNQIDRNKEDLIEDLELKQKIYNSLRHLPPKTKEIFTFNKLKGLTYVEIADHLNISVKTVESHMTKAFKQIRENWEF